MKVSESFPLMSVVTTSPVVTSNAASSDAVP